MRNFEIHYWTRHTPKSIIIKAVNALEAQIQGIYQYGIMPASIRSCIEIDPKPIGLS